MEIYIMAIRSSSSSGIPFGGTAGRPANPGNGQPYFNGDVGRLELYTTSTGWQNIVQETPGIASITGTYNESAGSGTFTISGTNFVSGGIVYAVGTNAVEYQATTSTYNSIVQMTATFTGLSSAYEPYDIKVVNPSNLFGLLPDAFFINNSPIWSTSSGSLGSATEGSYVSISLSASDPESTALTYAISSGSLPGGLSLNTSTGAISGTLSEISADTTYSFSVTASDGQNVISRAFSYSVINVPATASIQALVIAGGGGGAGDVGGAGGAGGILYHSTFSVTTGTPYVVAVGAGGAFGSQISPPGDNATNGVNSTFGVLTAIGGGKGASYGTTFGYSGGSGGGSSSQGSYSGGASTQTSNNGGIGYGNAGGASNTANYASGGGGGAGAAGNANSGTTGGAGGAGLNTWSTWASATSSGDNGYFAGGGGGGGGVDGGGNQSAAGGAGGGGRGWYRAAGSAVSGTANTGGGGGGTAGGGSSGGAGGSGIVIIRYADNYKDAASVTSGTKYTSGGYKYYKFTATGSITF
jgi:hypothetical protein